MNGLTQPRVPRLSTCAKTMQEVADELLLFATLVGDCGLPSAVGDHELLDLADKLNAARADLVAA
jgi:hypothetical protein